MTPAWRGSRRSSGMRTSKRSSTANTNSISASESRPSWSSVVAGSTDAGVDVELLDQHGGDGSEGRTSHAERADGEGASAHLMSRSARARRRRGRIDAPPVRPRAPPCRQTSLELPFADPAAAPLAERLRPKTLDEVIGQQHLLGPGKPLRVAFESGRLHSMILWGPPGAGKTTLARLMADAFDAQFIAMSAVLGGVKDIREAVERAQAARSARAGATVVFVDEVHRFNKSQQDAFLPHVESGLLHLHRRDHREPVVRGQLGAAVARHGARAEAARRRRPAATLLERAQALLDAPPLDRAGARRAWSAMPTATRGACSTPTRTWSRPSARSSAPRSTRRCSSTRSASSCAATTRAASSSTTPSRRCTRRCAAATPTPRCTGSCACSTAASTRATRRAAWCAWRARTSAWPTRARCAWRSTPPRPTSGSARPKASWRWPRRGLPGDGAEEQRGLQRLQRGARLHQGRRHPAGAAAPAQCADRADEGPRLRQGLPLRPRRGGRASPPASATGPTTWSRRASTSRSSAAWRSASASSCAELRAARTKRRSRLTRAAPTSDAPRPVIRQARCPA